MHVVFHNLHMELQQTALLLRSPELMLARLQAYETSQRRHDPNRLKRSAVSLEDHHSADQEPAAIASAAANPPTSTTTPQCVSSIPPVLVSTSSLPSIDEINALVGDLPQHHDTLSGPPPSPHELDAFLSQPLSPAAAPPLLNAATNVVPIEAFHCGKDGCKAPKHAACSLGFCKRCCVNTQGYCSVYLHAVDKFAVIAIYKLWA